MKKSTLYPAHISSNHNKAYITNYTNSNYTDSGSLRKNCKASITLEAALVMPIFILLFYVFYIFMIACASQMALQSLATSTVTSIATHMHPLDIASQKLNLTNNYSSPTIKDDVWEQVTTEVAELLPSPIGEIVQEGTLGNWWPAANLAATLLGQSVIENIVYTLPERSILQADHISLVYLQLPDLVNHTNYYTKITLQYELPLKIPLINKKVIVREQAMQRAWLPDPRGNSYAIEEGFIQILSITPNPIRPGHKATLKALTTPHTELSLEIVYKSGSSIAKNLGAATSSENGEIEWTWHVSGNTTPGVWHYSIVDQTTKQQVKGLFEIRKKQKG